MSTFFSVREFNGAGTLIATIPFPQTSVAEELIDNVKEDTQKRKAEKAKTPKKMTARRRIKGVGMKKNYHKQKMKKAAKAAGAAALLAED